METKNNAIIFLGSPGSGKSSIAERLSHEFERVEVIESGRLLRNEVRAESELGKKLEAHMEEGELVPLEMVVEAMINALKEIDVETLVFDGFPRNKEQVDIFFNLINEFDYELRTVLVFRISRDVAIERLTGRRICPNCGEVYNIHTNPPSEKGICDECGEELIQREDDEIDTVKNRLNVYKQETLPLAKYFEENFTLKTFDVSSESDFDDVFKAVLRVFQHINLQLEKEESSEEEDSGILTKIKQKIKKGD
jgi:adenylate kinase